MAYKLSIGYRGFLFANASDAAKVLDLLDRAVMVDTCYDGVSAKQLSYRTDHNIHLAKQEEGHIYGSYEEAQEVCNANIAKQQAAEAAEQEVQS